MINTIHSVELRMISYNLDTIVVKGPYDNRIHYVIRETTRISRDLILFYCFVKNFC